MSELGHFLPGCFRPIAPDETTCREPARVAGLLRPSAALLSVEGCNRPWLALPGLLQALGGTAVLHTELYGSIHASTDRRLL